MVVFVSLLLKTFKDDYEAIEENEPQSCVNISLQQRATFYCVPIPGESNWVKKVKKSILLRSFK